MDETRIIRGRRVVFERKDPVETLSFSLDVFNEPDNLAEVLCRLADLSLAQAAIDAAVAKYPNGTKNCDAAAPARRIPLQASRWTGSSAPDIC